MKKYHIKSKVWRWPGDAGWHFVTLDKKLSAEIKKIGKPYGAGFIKIRATIGQSIWDTALFPHSNSGSYLLAIKSAIRKREDIWEGEDVDISFVFI